MFHLISSTRLRRKIDYSIDVLEFIESIQLRDAVRQVLELLKKELVKFSNLLAKKDNPLTENKIADRWGVLQKIFLDQWQQMLGNRELQANQPNGSQIDWLKTIKDEIGKCFESSAELNLEDLRVEAKKRLLEYELVQFGEKIKTLLPTGNGSPSCFISYAWGNKTHEDQVHQIAYLLKRSGIEVFLDIWCDKVDSVPQFTGMINKEKSQFVVVIGTHLLKLKYDMQATGKGSWVHEELEQVAVRKRDYPNGHGIIKLLLEGPASQSFPEFLSPLAHDYTDFDLNQNYYEKFFNLLELLYAKYPEVKGKLTNLRQAFLNDEKIINQATKEELIELLQLNNPADYEKGQAEKENVFAKIKQASRLFTQFVERKVGNELLYAEILRNRLQSKYVENDQIKRLFYPNNPLSIASCYLHLALVQDKEVKSQQDKVNQKDIQRDYLLHEYECIDHVQQKLEVHEILNECKTVAKRIFIEGAAGSGKSTLCQRIAYDWSHGKDPWQSYKFLFHIRLRGLKNTDAYTKDYLGKLLQECFRHGDAELDDWQLERVRNEMRTNPRQAIFLLDGYDELQVDTDTLKKLLEPLKDYDFIVTSRRGSNFKADLQEHKIKLEQLLHLAVLGFSDQQIEQYISQFFDPQYTPQAEPVEAKACLEGLKSNPNLWSLAHIPIQLELLCGIWGDELKTQTTITLTYLYGLMLDKLLMRLAVERKGEHVGDIFSSELRNTYAGHINYLEYLAYLGVCNNQIVLDRRNYIEKALIDLNINNAKVFFGEVKALGLFKCEDGSKQGEFLHLTFQEFLAASYISKNLVLLRDFKKTNAILNSVCFWHFVFGLSTQNLSGVLDNVPMELLNQQIFLGLTILLKGNSCKEVYTFPEYDWRYFITGIYYDGILNKSKWNTEVEELNAHKVRLLDKLLNFIMNSSFNVNLKRDVLEVVKYCGFFDVHKTLKTMMTLIYKTDEWQLKGLALTVMLRAFDPQIFKDYLLPVLLKIISFPELSWLACKLFNEVEISNYLFASEVSEALKIVENMRLIYILLFGASREDLSISKESRGRDKIIVHKLKNYLIRLNELPNDLFKIVVYIMSVNFGMRRKKAYILVGKDKFKLNELVLSEYKKIEAIKYSDIDKFGAYFKGMPVISMKCEINMFTFMGKRNVSMRHCAFISAPEYLYEKIQIEQTLIASGLNTIKEQAQNRDFSVAVIEGLSFFKSATATQTSSVAVTNSDDLQTEQQEQIQTYYSQGLSKAIAATQLDVDDAMPVSDDEMDNDADIMSASDEASSDGDYEDAQSDFSDEEAELPSQPSLRF